MIKDLLQMEGQVLGIFMVKQQTKATSNNGSAYLSLTLQDSTGVLDAKMWQIEDIDIDLTTPGSLIRVDGLMTIYKGHPQLKILSVEGVHPSDVDISKYIPTAPKSLELMKKNLADYIDKIKDKEIHNLVKNLIDMNYESYTTYPAAVSVHHAYFGGLLYHSLSICEMAIGLQKHYPELSLDYLIAGSLLHDIGKTKELSSATAASYTSEGNLIGHVSLGAMMVNEEALKERITAEKREVLVHIILSHHGEPEFGSSKMPATREAFLIHMLDDLDAKMETLRVPYEATQEGDFTQKVTWIDNRLFYKPHKLD